MSICEEICKICTDQTKIDKKACELYEIADKNFDELIQKGVISKRGYQLLPIENKVCIDAGVNRSNT